MENKENKFDIFQKAQELKNKREDVEKMRTELEEEEKEIEREMRDMGYVKAEGRNEDTERVEKRSTRNSFNRFVAGILAGATIVAVSGGAGYLIRGCERDNNKGNSLANESHYEEVIDNRETENTNTDEIEIAEKNNTASRSEIEADRTYSFSQVIARINHYPDTVERNELLYWDVNESAGQVTVTRPYGELAEENPHNEKVEFEFYPNDEQAIFEWNELDIRANLPSGAFWIESDSTGGKVSIEFFDEKGDVIKKHEGEMVMAEWTDKNGQTRQAIQFKDNVSGETRPAAFQMFEIEFDSETGKAIDIKYPYHTANVTFEPTPGSRMTLKTGPTIPFAPDHDQGFGFYLWNQEETK